MTTVLKTKLTLLNKVITKDVSLFNDPISEDEINALRYNLPKLPLDLLELLNLSNGQKSNSTSLFIKLNGSTVLKYDFLNSTEIIELHKFIQNITNDKIDPNLIPFAKYEKDIGDKGSMAFAINYNDNSIYHILFYEYDRFTTVYEHRSEKFAKNLTEFIDSEIEWQKFTYC